MSNTLITEALGYGIRERERELEDSSSRAAAAPSAQLSCRFCGSATLSLAFHYPDRDGRPTQIYLCRKCSSLVPHYEVDAHPRAMLDLQTDYHERFWAGFSEVEAQQLAADCAGIVTYYQDKLDRDKGLVLELGAGRGGLLESLRKQGYRARGCEPARQLVALAQKAYGFDDETLRCSDADHFLREISQSGQKVQAVFLWHVLEHVAEPLSLLTQIASVLNPRGVLIAQVPLLQQEYIYQEHLFFLSEIAVAIAARACGLCLEDVNYDLDRKYMAFVLRKNAHATAGGRTSSVAADAPARDISPLSTALRKPGNGIAAAEDRSTAVESNASNEAPEELVDINALLAGAEICYQRGEFAAAGDHVRKAIALEPNRADLVDTLGGIEWRKGNLAGAKEIFRKLALLRPGSADPYVKIAALALELDRPAEAEANIVMARKYDPHGNDVLKTSGNLYLQQNQFELAARSFGELLQKNPKDIDALLAVTKCRFKLGDLDGARAACEEAIRLEPDNAIARESLEVLQSPDSAIGAASKRNKR